MGYIIIYVTMHSIIVSFPAEQPLEERPAVRTLWRGAPNISFADEKPINLARPNIVYPHSRRVGINNNEKGREDAENPRVLIFADIKREYFTRKLHFARWLASLSARPANRARSAS